MPYSERPNIHLISTQREPRETSQGLSRFVRELTGLVEVPKSSVHLVAIELHDFDPTNTSALGRGVLYALSDAGKRDSLLYYPDDALTTNGTNATRPMDEILNDLEEYRVPLYAVTNLKDLGQSGIGTGSLRRNDLQGFELFRTIMMNQFEQLTGVPMEFAFRIGKATTVQNIRDGVDMDFAPLAIDAEILREGWEIAGLLKNAGSSNPQRQHKLRHTA